MASILIPLKNTPWGVVPHPQKAPTYEHILSFDSDELKTQFIGKFLFNNVNFNYKEAIKDKAFERSFTQTSSTKGTITGLDLAFFNNNQQNLHYTRHDILNMDFLILKENNTFSFWTVDNVTKDLNQEVFSVDLTLDIFFTHDIKDVINDNPVEIEVAHFDRFKKAQDGKYIPNINMLTPNGSNEKFDEAITDANMYPVNSEELEYDYSDYIETSLTDKEKYVINKNINHIRSLILYSTKKLHELTSNSYEHKEFVINGYTTSYYVYEFIFIDEFWYPDFDDPNKMVYNAGKEHLRIIHGSETHAGHLAGLKDFAYFQDQAGVIHNASSLSPISSIIQMYHYDLPSHMKPFTMDTFGDIVLQMEDPDTLFGWENINVAKYKNKDYDPHAIQQWFILNPFKFDLFNNPSPNDKNKKYPILAKWTPWYGNNSVLNFTPNINNKANLEWETKTITSNYSKIKIKGMSDNEFEFKREFINFEENLYLQQANTYQPDLWRQIIGVYGTYNYLHNNNEYDFKKTIYGQLIPENRLLLDDRNSYTLPTDTNAWNEYLARNKASLNTALLKGKVGIAAGAVGAVGALATGHFGAAVAGIFGATQSALSLQATFSKVKDIKNTPNTLNATGGSLNGDIKLSNLQPKIIYSKLDPLSLSKLETHFMKYGVTYMNNLYNFRSIIDSRYYYNHVQSPSVFSNIEVRLSAPIKVQISETLAEGVTIWHVRNIDTFKGIKNYDYDNVERSLLLSSPTIKIGNMSRNSTNDLHLEIQLIDNNIGVINKKTSIVDLAYVSSKKVSLAAHGITFPYINEAMNPWDRIVNTSASGDVKLETMGTYDDFKLNLKWKVEGSSVIHQDTYDLKGFEIPVSAPSLDTYAPDINKVIFDKSKGWLLINFSLKDNNVTANTHTTLNGHKIYSKITSNKVAIQYPDFELGVSDNVGVFAPHQNYQYETDGIPRLAAGTYDDFKLKLSWYCYNGPDGEKEHITYYDIEGFVIE